MDAFWFDMTKLICSEELNILWKLMLLA